MKSRKILTVLLLCAIIAISVSGYAMRTADSEVRTEASEKTEVNAEAVETPSENSNSVYSAEDYSIWFDERRGNRDYAEPIPLPGSRWSNERFGGEQYILAFMPMDDEHPLASVGQEFLGDSVGYALLYSEPEYAFGHYMIAGSMIEIAFLSPEESIELAKKPELLSHTLAEIPPNAKAIGNFNMALSYNRVTDRMERTFYASQNSDEAIYPQDDGRDMKLICRYGHPDYMGG